MKILISKVVAAPAALLLVASAALAQTRPPSVVSPEVSPDRHITFRILAPDADEVSLSSQDVPQLVRQGSGASPEAVPQEMTKGEDGVWEFSVGPVAPGTYRYSFLVDGIRVMDTLNPDMTVYAATAWNIVHVPGSDLFDTRQVPHGALATITYYSSSLEEFRQMQIYTPPGYEAGSDEQYPVLYLLHGGGGAYNSWPALGRSNFILDNLLAAGDVKPMIVVTTSGQISRTQGGPPRTSDAEDGFTRDFINDVVPYVEENYRVLTDRPNRAIAGLSMGGSQTMNIAFLYLEKFAYIGVFSSGAALGGSDDATSAWETVHQSDLDDDSLKEGTKLIWMKTGVDDPVFDRSTETVEMLERHGFSPHFEESAGAHTWDNWRDYLTEFTPLLFQ